MWLWAKKSRAEMRWCSFCCLCLPRVIYKLVACKSESIRVQSLKVLGYFLKHLGHKWVTDSTKSVIKNLEIYLPAAYVFVTFLATHTGGKSST